MHILLLSDHETRGGAATATSRLAHGLIACGVQVSRLVAYPAQGAHAWEREQLATPLFPLRRALRRGLPLNLRGPFDQSATAGAHQRFRAMLTALKPDLIHLHNMHGGIGAGWSPELLRVAAEYAPVCWTLHDMWSFTGRCAYSQSCTRFIAGCNAECPTPREYPALAPAQIAPAWAQRRDLLAHIPQAVAIAPSRWMAAQARLGLWREHEVAHIPNGINLHTYAPADRQGARRALGLPEAGRMALIAMPHLADPRKGGGLITPLAAVLAARGFSLITMGAGELRLDIPGLQLHPLGYIAAEAKRALAYSAADLLIHAAPADNLPSTIIEALACGTPVVAMPVGGVPDLVRPAITGWLATEPTVVSLAQQLAQAIDAVDNGRDLRVSCRMIAEQEYSLEQMVQCHLELYQRLIG